MYAETGLMFPYFQDLSQEVQHLDDFCKSQRPNSPSVSIIAEYDLGGEGDLFKAPEPIIEEPLMGIDPMTAAISMISSGQDVILPQGLKVSDIVSLQTEPLFSDVYYECEKDLMEKESRNMALDEVVLGDKILPLTIDEKEPLKDEIPVDIPFTGMPTQKSVSLECLNSMNWIQGAPMKPSFLDFPVLEFGAAYGMRRAYSEGDIKSYQRAVYDRGELHSRRAQGKALQIQEQENKEELREEDQGRLLQTVNPGSEVDSQRRKKSKLARCRSNCHGTVRPPNQSLEWTKNRLLGRNNDQGLYISGDSQLLNDRFLQTSYFHK